PAPCREQAASAGRVSTNSQRTIGGTIMTEILQTQEVGSLAKPNWRVEAVRDGQLTDANIAEIYAWSERLGLNEADTSIEITGILQDFGCDEAQCHDSAKDRVRDLAAS